MGPAHTSTGKVAPPAAVNAIPRIQNIEPLADYRLAVLFDDGRRVLYDVNDDIATLEEFKNLKTVVGLWNSVQLDKSRTVVYWNDRIDLPSDTLYEYGVTIS